MEVNVARYGNCFIFNSKYNLGDDTLYVRNDDKYIETENSRLSTLTGPSFGLNLIVGLDQNEYMKGGITKQVQIICLLGANW